MSQDGIDWAGPAIGGALALAGSALTQWLQGRGTRQLAEDDRVVAQRQEHLSVLTDVVVNARAWADGAHILLLGLHKGGTQFAMEFIETDSGKERQALMKELSRVLTRAKVTVTDPSLRQLVVELAKRIDNSAEEINGPAMKTDRHTPSLDDLLASERKLYALERMVAEIEVEAMRLSAAAIRTDRRRPRVTDQLRRGWRGVGVTLERWTRPNRARGNRSSR